MERVTLTRDELYTEVWETPMKRLAQKYGLSDVGLAKACKRLRIPRPGRGYWARKQAGKPARKMPLPKLPENQLPYLNSIVLGKELEHAPEKTEAVPVDPVREFESRPESRINVPEVLVKPHPLIALSVRALRRARTTDEGHLRPSDACLFVRVSIESVDRAMRILDAFLKAAEARGYSASLSELSKVPRQESRLLINGEHVSFLLSERMKLTVHTPEPPKKPRYGWEPPPYTPRPERRFSPTGELTLQIDEYAGKGLRKVWTDGKESKRLEDRLNEIMLQFTRVADALRLQRLENEERERRYEAERREREAAREAEEREKGLETLARDLAGRWRTAREIREYAGAIRDRIPSLVEERRGPATAWVDWLDKFVERLDPVTSFRVPTAMIPESELTEWRS